MDVRQTWTDCDEAGDYVIIVPNVLSPRDLVFRPDNMDKTVLHTYSLCKWSFHMELSFRFCLSYKHLKSFFLS